MIETSYEIIGNEIEYEIAFRQAGYPAVLIASSEKIKKEVGWQTIYSSIKDIILSA